jgi:hypothetical protein
MRAQAEPDTLRTESSRSRTARVSTRLKIACSSPGNRQIREQHNPASSPEELPGYFDRRAFVIRYLKTPEELETLRAIYGSRLVVIAAYSSKDQRLEDLATKIASSRGRKNRKTW